jgi:Mce-associated membrane protein
VATHQSRRRPLAGQRSRSRLEPGTSRPEAAEAAALVERADTAAPAASVEPVGASTASRPRRTALLERARPAATAAPADDDAAALAAPGRPAARRTPDLLVLVAGVLVLALVLTAAVLTVKARGENRTERARTDAVAVAESRAVDLLSYDYRHLDRDFGRAAKGLTGRFAQDYAHTTESVVRPTAEQVHAVVTAEVVASSVVRAAQNRVTVLLFVNQTTTSTRVEGPQTDLTRVRMTLIRSGDTWKISAVTAL